jgi:hypothetical protein
LPVCCHSVAAMDAANLLRRSICTHSFFSDAAFFPPHRERKRALAPPESECSSTRRLQAKGLNNSLWPEEKKEALPGSVCCRRFNDLGYTRGVTSRGQSVQTTLRERERMTPRFCWLPRLLGIVLQCSNLPVSLSYGAARSRGALTRFNGPRATTCALKFCGL